MPTGATESIHASSKSTQWDTMCAEFEAARNDLYSAMGDVIPNFAAVSEGDYSANPALAAVTRYELAQMRFDTILKAMRQFAEDNC